MSAIIGSLEEAYDRSYGDGGLVRRYAGFASRYKKHLYRTIVAILVGTGFMLLVPFTLQLGVDAFLDNMPQMVLIGAAGYLALNILAWLAEYVNTYENTKFTARTTQDIRQDLFEKVQHHDMSFFDKNKTGLLMSRVMDDTQVLAEFIALTGTIATNILVAIGTVIILFIINPQLTLLALSVVPFLIIFILIFRRIARRLARNWRVTISKLNASFQENISGISVSKSFGRIDKARDEFEALNNENYQTNVKRAIFFSSIFPVIFTFSNIGLAMVLYYGGILSIQTNVPTAGTLVLYFAFLQRFYFPLVILTNYYGQLQAGLAAAERIFSLSDAVSLVKDEGTIHMPAIDGEIKFKDVTFHYDDGTTVFDNFNLIVNPGETIAIVGHTGAGKSTLISLLLRFYAIQSGKIFVDGEDISIFTLNSYRSSIGMVLQDPLLFSGSLKSNITYGVEETNQRNLELAISAANLTEFISSQPEGIETTLSERGRRLSQGQKQLISLARAFLVNPRILLLDEATASIDSYSEALIQEAIERLLHDRTSIIIAHRLTTVKRADRIVVLEHGKITEIGSHEELLQKRGHYSELFAKYFAFQKVEG